MALRMLKAKTRASSVHAHNQATRFVSPAIGQTRRVQPYDMHLNDIMYRPCFSVLDWPSTRRYFRHAKLRAQIWGGIWAHLFRDKVRHISCENKGQPSSHLDSTGRNQDGLCSFSQSAMPPAWHALCAAPFYGSPAHRGQTSSHQCVGCNARICLPSAP